MNKPRIVQHSFGSPGSGGPIGALGRVLASDINNSFDFLHVTQPYPAKGLNLKLVIHMAREMRAFQPDLAHIRGLGNEGFHGVIAARVAGVPRILLSVHGSVRDLVSGPVGVRRLVLGRIIEPITLRWATHVVTVCEDALDKPILYASARKLVGVVPNGVDVVNAPEISGRELRRTLSIGSDDIVLIIVARLVVDKGGLDLLEALKSLSQESTSKGVHLLVVGDGPDRELISDQARTVENVQIHMLGVRHDVAELFGASDIALLPSWHENMSNALLEAMAAGVPVIATSVGGNTEIVSQGGGVLVPPHDPPALAAAIQGLILDRHRRLMLGREARSVIEAGYTTRHMTRRLSDVYRTILGS
jgi:glycosyltransferase involved in cell wall biosynthesis